MNLNPAQPALDGAGEIASRRAPAATRRVVVSQIGAREHYAIARMCHRAGALARLHTDLWTPPDRPLKKLIGPNAPRALRRALGRFSAEIPADLVTAHPTRGAYWLLRLAAARTEQRRWDVYLRQGESFARQVARRLEAGGYETLLAYSSAALEALRKAREQGRLTILDDIAPVHLERDLLREERRAHPGLEPLAGEPSPAYLDRIEAEWEAADRIIVNSQWTRRALASRGVPPAKLHVVPLAFEANEPFRPRHRRPRLHVLWLGTLCLRKGFHYALEAARQLQALPVDFTFAGPALVDLGKVRWPSNARYLGQVPRAEARHLFRTHDVFLFPTLSDGFGITQLEAMAHGLPVIATACCASVVESGRDGLVIGARSAEAIAEAIRSLLDGALDLEAASALAADKASRFSLASVWTQLSPVLD